MSFDENDITRWVAFFGEDGGPETCVATANDAEVATFGADQGWVRIGFVYVFIPVGICICVGDRVEMTLVHGFTTL